MSNSSLVNYTKISPNRNSPRNHAIDTITIHCVVGQCSVETIGNVFAPTSRRASSNYGIGPDGRIGMYVEEKDRSWCSSSRANDNRAITIEVASDTTHPYAVTDAAYEALIKLCADICKRNGIKELKWRADKSLIGQVDKQNMTVHRWFANKACPGDYLFSRHGDIAKRVNELLGVSVNTEPVPDGTVKPGSVIKLIDEARYDNGKRIPDWVLKSTLYAREIRKDGHVVFSTQKTGDITGSVGPDQIVGYGCCGPKEEKVTIEEGDEITLVKGAKYVDGAKVPQWVIDSTLYARDIRKDGNVVFSTQKTGAITGVVAPSQIAGGGCGDNGDDFLVKVTASALNIRSGPSTDYKITGVIKNKGVYTIVETKCSWGKLKSGAGWISLKYTERV